MLNSLNLFTKEEGGGKRNTENQYFNARFLGGTMTEEGLSILFPFILLGNLDRQTIIPVMKAALHYIIVIIKILH